MGEGGRKKENFKKEQKEGVSVIMEFDVNLLS